MPGNQNKRPINSPESDIAQKDKALKMDKQIMDKLVSMDDRIAKGISDVTQRVINIETNLATLLERLIKNENAIEALKCELSETRSLLNVRDQQDLANHFRLSGLPPVGLKKEDCKTFMIKVLSVVGVPATQNDFEYATVFKTGDNASATLVGKFVNIMKRREAFKAFRAKSKDPGITWGDMATSNNPNDGSRKLFLRSNLTKPTMTLLNRAREHKDIFKFIWEDEGRIMLRKSENERYVELKSLRQLQQLVEATG